MLPLNSNAKLRKNERKTKKLISFFAETEQFRDLLTAKFQKKCDIQIVLTLFFSTFFSTFSSTNSISFVSLASKRGGTDHRN